VSDHSTIPTMHPCSYCGSWHMYSDEMCRDLNKKWDGKPLDLEEILAGANGTVRSLRLEVGRLSDAMDAILAEVPADRLSAYAKEKIDAALSTPGDGLWEEVRHLCEMVLRLKVGDEMELPILQAASAVLGRKP